MPAYHSATNSSLSVCKMAFCPLNTKTKGPAPSGDGQPDIVDEAINLFRANVWFKSFDIKSDSDRTLIYCILYITELLKAAAKTSDKLKLTNEFTNMGQAKFDIPYEGNFPLNAFFKKPEQGEGEKLRGYIGQLRQELGLRLMDKLYPDSAAKPSKWWLQFSKKKFMDMSLAQRGH